MQHVYYFLEVLCRCETPNVGVQHQPDIRVLSGWGENVENKWIKKHQPDIKPMSEWLKKVENMAF